MDIEKLFERIKSEVKGRRRKGKKLFTLSTSEALEFTLMESEADELEKKLYDVRREQEKLSLRSRLMWFRLAERHGCRGDLVREGDAIYECIENNDPECEDCKGEVLGIQPEQPPRGAPSQSDPSPNMPDQGNSDKRANVGFDPATASQ